VSARQFDFEDDPLWYKDAVIYQLHVKTFFDSNDDGIGDFRGLIQKLDYLEDLGVTTIWLLPFYPSPLKDDGYDIADYMSINSDYGMMRDFRSFMREAHRRGIRVITELVINHTSDQHQWFKRARKAMERYPGQVPGRTDHFPGFRTVELGVGSRCEILLLAPVLLSPARPELR